MVEEDLHKRHTIQRSTSSLQNYWNKEHSHLITNGFDLNSLSGRYSWMLEKLIASFWDAAVFANLQEKQTYY